MRITIATAGSRGDVQPFLAVALARAGHAVRLATCEPFRALVGSYGIGFGSIGGAQPWGGSSSQAPVTVYVGFGSMTVEQPEALSQQVARALRRAGQRAVLSTGWGALARVEGEDLLVVGDLPHAWLFPRMAAVVHHGGPSTTAEASWTRRGSTAPWWP